MNSKFVAMWFEAPMQSWGADSKFGRRDTMKFPTKSGILGILLSGMGASGPQNELLADLSIGKMTVISFTQEKKVREPLLRDFHMVGSGYDDKNLWEKLLIPKTSDGKPANGGGAKMTYRYYLQDARFSVIFEIPDKHIEKVTEALQSPVYDIYLGRKSCVPTDFIFRGVFVSEADAEDKILEISNSKKLLEEFRVLDGEHEGDIMTLNDIPVQFGEIKKYRDRRVTVVHK